MTSASEKTKIDKYIYTAAKIAACRELFVKYKGRSHDKIQAEMREMGFHDFSRRILYARKQGTGKRPGWITEFGWNDRTASGPLANGDNWTASGSLANSGSSAVTASRSEVLEIFDPAPDEKTNSDAGEQDAHPPIGHAGGTGVGKRAACGPVGGKRAACGPVSGELEAHPPVGSAAYRQALVQEEFDNFQTWLERVSPGMTWTWKHQIVLYEHLKRITDGTNKRLMIFMPPRHGKSELVTVRYAAWRLRRDPKMKIILASYGQELANTFSRKIKNVICEDLASLGEAVGSEPPAVAGGAALGSVSSGQPGRPATRHQIAPPATAGGTDSVFPFSHQRPVNTAAQWGTTLGGGVRAVGVGCGVTGFGGDLVIIDDPIKNRAQAESETYRDRVWNWYTDDLYTRLEPDAKMILIQTRWHEDDLAGRLIKQMNEGGEFWEIVDLPALAEDGTAKAGTASGSLANSGSSAVTELGSEERGIDVPTADEKTNLSDPNRIHAGGTGVGKRAACGPIDRPPVKVIGFPAFYSRVKDFTASDSLADGDNRTASGSLANSGSSAVTELGSEDRAIDVPTLDEKTNSETGEQDAHPPVGHAGGTYVDKRAACGPSDRPPVKVIGFPAFYSRVKGLTASDSLADGDNRTASGSLANSGSSAVTELGSEDRAIDVPTPDEKDNSDTGEQDAHPPVGHAGGIGVGKRDACGPVVGDRAACGPVVDWRLPGDALCPERFDIEELEKIRVQLGMFGFSALYQQKPTPPDGAIFKREWLRNIIETPPPGLRWFRGYDLAVSTKTTADYTASFRVALDEMGNLYIADGYRERLEYPEQRRFIIERIRSERDTRHGIEDSSSCKSIIDSLRREKDLLRFSFKPVPVINDKLTRALAWSHLAEAGKLKLVRGAWIKPFVSELIRFPKGKHDDQVDAVSVAVQLMAEPTDKKLHRF